MVNGSLNIKCRRVHGKHEAWFSQCYSDKQTSVINKLPSKFIKHFVLLSNPTEKKFLLFFPSALTHQNFFEQVIICLAIHTIFTLLPTVESSEKPLCWRSIFSQSDTLLILAHKNTIQTKISFLLFQYFSELHTC